MSTSRLRVGDAVPEFRVKVEPAPMAIMTLLTDDPNPIHFDRSVVARLGLGDRLVNQGALNLAYPVNAVLRLVGGDPSRLLSIRLRFLGNVLEGDEVIAGGEVTEVDDSAGTATLALWLDVVGGTRTLEGSAQIAAHASDSSD